MADLLAERDVLPSIDYNMFGFHDRWCDAGDDGESMTAARETVVAASTYQVSVQARSHRAGLTVRVWNDRPPDQSGWDGHHEMELHCPTGEMVADQVTGGLVAVIDVPAGVYGLRAYWRDREAAAAEISAAYSRPADEVNDAVEAVAGRERYLFDMWRIGPLPPDDDDDDFANADGIWS